MKKISPLVIVSSVFTLLDTVMIAVYPFLEERFEKITFLALIVIITLSIVFSFVFLWIKRPGHLYSPSEFTGLKSRDYGHLYCSFCGQHSDLDKNGVCRHCDKEFRAKKNA